MSNLKPISRRTALRIATAAILGGVSHSLVVASNRIPLTPAQTEGPFSPEKDQADKDVDLTTIKGQSKRAEGEVIEVSGHVYDRMGVAVVNALVEIWQANKWGRYMHSKDPSKAPLDANFQGWGQIQTDNKGFYKFKTIMPGAYPASPIWMRPPHIHFKVWVRDVIALTTQMYFPGNKHNADDQILNRLTFEERGRLISEVKDNEDTKSDVVKKCKFDMVIQPTSFV